MQSRTISFFNRLFFSVAVILFIVAVIDWVMRLFGYTLSFLPYTPGRLFEFAAIMMVFVMVALLRQIRDQLKGQ
ncbi:hypothetical protein GF377_07790 [candidate division GN15 bacterium]|nr:hypothetical protein [candidate division GN15 bacterium]